MAYYHRVLQPDETVKAIARLHWLMFWPSALWIIVAIAIAVVGQWVAQEQPQRNYCFYSGAAIGAIGVLVFLGEYLRRQSTEIVVTDKRVIYKRGLFSRYTAEMNLSKVETVDVEQSVAGRLLGYGTVVVRGVGAGIEPLRQVGEPLALRNAILAG